MGAYRVLSMLQAVAYLWLTSSLWLYPPEPSKPGQVTVFDSVARPGVLVSVFVLCAMVMLVTAAWWPKLVYLAHTFFIPVLVFYGTANLSTSIQNKTGYQIAALCLVGACGHAIALVMRRRADEIA